VGTRRTGVVRLVVINLLVFFVIANVLYWAIPTYRAVEDIVRSATASRAPGRTETDEVWRQTVKLSTKYISYIEWRRDHSSGTLVNVVGPYRQRLTVNPPAAADAKEVYFFGGSTMWGTGVSDRNTIPSQFAEIAALHAENFGEAAYVAHQSLLLLIQVLEDGRRPNLVVFYDGVNDVSHKCRTEVSPTSHVREPYFEERLSAPTDSFRYYFQPVINVFRGSPVGVRSGRYDCVSNPRKAEAIAENLVRDWTMAKIIVEAYGGQFVGILQPVSYLTPGAKPPLWTDPEQGAQFAAVYPLIRQKLSAGEHQFDVVSALDGHGSSYTDFCHLDSSGNRIMAEAILKVLAPLGLGEPSAAHAADGQ
jgi:lysophospholipase L1-like esterase